MVQLIKTQANNEDNLWIVRTSGKVNHIPMEFETKLGYFDNIDIQLNPVIIFDALYKQIGIQTGTEDEFVTAMKALITDFAKLKPYTDNDFGFRFDVLRLAQDTIGFDFNGSTNSFISDDFKIEVVNPFGETYRVSYSWDDLVNALKDLHIAK